MISFRDSKGQLPETRFIATPSMQPDLKFCV
jgi:hypothetical protein